ncbi:MAG TPA: hypothetical protein VND22_09390 [Actinomycetota bacterium]|nr:hypothetical protein [Actinomycetota bacterium]
MRRALRVVLLFCFLLPALTIAAPAASCSCVDDHPRIQVRQAEAAFVGRLVGIQEGPLSVLSGGSDAVWTFEVERVVKGELHRREHVNSPLSGASCGFEVAVGERAGVVLSSEDGAWRSGLCSTVEPDALIAAGRPVPDPLGGEIAFIAGSDAAGSQSLALDGEGRVAAYGLPASVEPGMGFQRSGTKVSVCPGQTIALEETTTEISVRALTDFKINAVIPSQHQRSAWIHCTNSKGPQFLRLLLEDWRSGQLERWNGNQLLSSVKVFPGTSLLDDQTAYVLDVQGELGPSYLSKLDLETGAITAVEAFAGSVDVYPSPDRAKLLVIQRQRYGGPVTVRVLDFASTEPEKPGLARAWHWGPAAWVDDSRFVISRVSEGQGEIPPELVMYGADLNEIGRINGLGLNPLAVTGGKVFGFDEGGFFRADPLTGEFTKLSEIDGRQPSALVALEAPRPILGPGWVPEKPPLADFVSTGSLIPGEPPARQRRSPLAVPALILVVAVAIGLLRHPRLVRRAASR